jgi:dihydrolipoamide dehydrogenase
VEQKKIDVAILGAGTAGLAARRGVLRAKRSVLLIDPGPLGTTCARVGCMPSKLLIAAADAASLAREAGVFGVRCERVRVDGPAVLERVRRERDRFVGSVLVGTSEAARRGELLQGRGRLIGPHTLQVDDHTVVEAGTVIVATGSSPWVPPPYRSLGDLLLGSAGVFELDDLPESVLVVGTGIIGLELGQALHRLGVRTTIVGIGGFVGPLLDPRMKAEALAIFGRELDIHPDMHFESVERVEGGARLRYTTEAGEARDQVFARVLVAAGRKPNLDGLGLDRAGIVFPAGKVPAFDPATMQVGDSHIFLAGDVDDDRPLLHEAADEGAIAGQNAATWPDVMRHPRRTPLGIVFCDPQIAVVGAPWSAMACDRNRVGEADYADQGRARVMNQNRGRVRIYGEAGTGLLHGAEMLGPRVEHTAHLLAWAIQQRLTVSQALAMPFYHPVFEEGIRTALRDLEEHLRIGHAHGDPCEEFGPGA